MKEMNGSFENLIVWQKSRILAKEMYRLFGKLPDYAFRDQILRATISVMNNIAEGHERRSSLEWRQFLYIAKASAGEVRSMIYLAADLNYLDLDTKEKFIRSSEEIAYMLASLIRKL
jgi:four helix bundle protein